MSVLLIKGPPDDEVSAMMPLVTHSSPEETEGLIDVQDNNDDEQEEDEEDLELDQPLGSPRRSSIRVSQSELLESLKPGKIQYLLKKSLARLWRIDFDIGRGAKSL